MQRNIPSENGNAFVMKGCVREKQGNCIVITRSFEDCYRTVATAGNIYEELLHLVILKLLGIRISSVIDGTLTVPDSKKWY